MYLWQYVAGSVALTAAVTAKALALYPNYYSAMLSISGNSASLCVFLNQGICILWLAGKMVLHVIFGELRLAEIEYIYQRFWFLTLGFIIMASNIPEASQALDFGAMIAMTGFLLVIHWVLQERSKVMFQMLAVPTKLQVIKVYLFNMGLIYVDVHLCTYAYQQLMHGNRLVVSVAPEFYDLLQIGIQSLFNLSTDFYEAYVADLEEDEEWENKQKIMFVVNIVLEVLGFTVYSIIYYLLGALSAHLVVGLLNKGRKIYTLCCDFYQFFTATSSLESWVCDPVPEDIARDNTCVICREEMEIEAASERVKPRKMQCGHIIHFACLKSWLGRSQNCPTCRQPVKTAKSAFDTGTTSAAITDGIVANAIAAGAATGPVAAEIAAGAAAAGHGPAARTPGTQTPQGVLSRPTSPQGNPIDTSNWLRYATRATGTGQEINIGDQWYQYKVIRTSKREI